MYADISHLGDGFLAAVFLLSGFAMILGLAVLSLREEMAGKVLYWARRVMFTAVGLAVITLVLLAIGFLRNDFSIAAVSQYSSTDLPVLYKLSAVWASSAGSLLLWSVFVFVLFGLWLMAGCRWKIADSEETVSNEQSATSVLKFNAAALAIGAGLCLGFSALCLFVAKPFAASPAIVSDGAGLNPLLQDFWMIVHPPLLFVGYAALLVPFVIVSAAVFTGRATDPYVYRQLRRWLLFGICFLGLGIAAGARWSYLELGWGGYWAWDPVENLSLLPWLVAVAALHSLVGAQDSDRFKRWSIVLVPVPFILCLVATFITRSGLLTSLHTFGQDVMFSTLLVFIICCFLLWILCVITAVGTIPIKPPRVSPFYLNKNDLLFWVNVILILTAIVIGIATFYPIVSRFIVHSKLDFTLTRPFYDRIISVVGILLAFLVGLGAMAGFQKRSGFVLRVLACCVVGLMCFEFVFNFGGVTILMSLACGICAFSFVAVSVKLLSGRANGKISAGIAHLGFLILVVAAGFSSMEKPTTMRLIEGEKFVFGKYEFVYDSFRRESVAGVTKIGPEVTVTKGNLVKKLWPHNNLYPGDKSSPEVAIHTSWFEDVYVSFDSVSPQGRVVMSVKIKPLMLWVWFAAVLIVAGLALAMFEGQGVAKREKAAGDKSGADESYLV